MEFAKISVILIGMGYSIDQRRAWNEFSGPKPELRASRQLIKTLIITSFLNESFWLKTGDTSGVNA